MNKLALEVEAEREARRSEDWPSRGMSRAMAQLSTRVTHRAAAVQA